jgi:hypothetical protein
LSYTSFDYTSAGVAHVLFFHFGDEMVEVGIAQILRFPGAGNGSKSLDGASVFVDGSTAKLVSYPGFLETFFG